MKFSFDFTWRDFSASLLIAVIAVIASTSIPQFILLSVLGWTLYMVIDSK